MLRPPCSIVNINGQTEPALVQVSGVYLSSYETEDCSTKFDPINNGTLYPDINGDGRPDTFCDSTGNLFLVGDTNSFNPRIHIEFDHDWMAAGWAGASTTYDSNETITRCHPVMVKRSEEHTSELQSLTNLVCRLLLEKKKTTTSYHKPAL